MRDALRSHFRFLKQLGSGAPDGHPQVAVAPARSHLIPG
jgi:hypothetical protein